MDKFHYGEMLENLNRIERDGLLQGRAVYLFGHCNATEELVDLLLERGYRVSGILDNNCSKHGTLYRGVVILPPSELIREAPSDTIVCIVARAYEVMAKQLRKLGYTGRVEKLVDYNSYAEYSLSEESVAGRQQRVERGIGQLRLMQAKYPEAYRVYCPFSALGDVYYAMAYLPYFLERKGIHNYVVFVIGRACGNVAAMFGTEHIEVLSQREMDEQIQAVLYTKDADAYIPHQDRPYVVNLYKALYSKLIPLETIYKCGVYGLDMACKPHRPSSLETYEGLEAIPEGRAVILSPYAKSVANIPREYWQEIISHYTERGYQIFTNAVGEEETLPGTLRLEVRLSQLQSVAERAGTFIGLRSGLCDVIKAADCKKIALYPDRFYSDTKWKMAEIYHLEGWENIVIPQ